ncbi:hypothetical protein CGCSCA1_v009255 [Colletotrichum siamense]|nr:hypothetical protein CGCSCA1_v009255 [Colletotrichum siamense]
MEALGIVANVIAVVDLSFKLGVLCGDYINKARNAKDDIQKLKAESVALSRNISQVKDLLDGENISQRRQLVASEKFRGDVKQCEQVLQKLLTKLDPKSNPSRLRVISESLKWPLTSKEVERTIIDLQGWRQSFASAMQVDHL